MEEFLNSLDTEIDLGYVYQDGMTFEEFEEAVERYIQESSDIIYYYKAIKFLQKNDPSLRESLELAEELGFTPSSLNSETLASLLNERLLMQEWWDIREEVEEFFEENL